MVLRRRDLACSGPALERRLIALPWLEWADHNGPSCIVHHSKFGKAIRAALDKPDRTEGVRKIAARFGVDPGTVQRISIHRPFAGASVAA
jgi:hypothetical protein